MVMEKGQALAQAQVAAAFALLGGGRAPAIAKKTISIYAQRVRKNRRRLSRRRRVTRRAPR
jgi:hypothetical protein